MDKTRLLAASAPHSDNWHHAPTVIVVMMMMMMMKLPILPCAEKPELVLCTAPKTSDNTDKDSKNRSRRDCLGKFGPTYANQAVSDYQTRRVSLLHIGNVVRLANYTPSPFITPSPFHSKLKTYIFGKSFPHRSLTINTSD